MIRRIPGGWFGWLAAALLLNACTAVTVREAGAPGGEAYQQRAKQIVAFEEWGLVGKFSLDDGEDGGSGRLSWDVQPAGSDLGFRGVLGRGAWQLQVREHNATLKEADGTVQTAADVNELIHNRIGWSVPIEALAWWVRGLKAPGEIGHEQFDADGRLLNLQQHGWTVEFKRYRSIGEIVLPVRLEAQRDSYRVKLAVGRWRLGPE